MFWKGGLAVIPDEYNPSAGVRPPGYYVNDARNKVMWWTGDNWAWTRPMDRHLRTALLVAAVILAPILWVTGTALAATFACGSDGCLASTASYSPEAAVLAVILAGVGGAAWIAFLPRPKEMLIRLGVAAAVAVVLMWVSAGSAGITVNGCPRAGYEQCVERLLP